MWHLIETQNSYSVPDIINIQTPTTTKAVRVALYQKDDEPNFVAYLVDRQAVISKSPPSSFFGRIELSIQEESTLEPKRLYIKQVDNLSSQYKHVATALLEFAFRFSLEKNLYGELKLQAVRHTHMLYYQFGFRPLINNPLSYYMKLANALKEVKPGERIKKDLGSEQLFLPPIQVLNLLDKYHLSESLLDTPLNDFYIRDRRPQYLDEQEENEIKNLMDSARKIATNRFSSNPKISSNAASFWRAAKPTHATLPTPQPLTNSYRQKK